LARPGPVTSDELDGEAVVVTGHRDGAGYDRAVAQMLAEFGLSPVLRRGGPGPALFGPVADGQALALSTAAGAAAGDVLVRPFRPARDVSFELLWRDETPTPALREFIRIGEALVASGECKPKRHLAVAA
jgi:hypothetical protein